MKLHIESEEALKKFACEFAPSIRGGMNIALCGPLGSGKTTFVRYLAEALGATAPVFSPTYVLQHEYECTGGIILEHWDLYRLASLPMELAEGAEPTHVRIVEWAERSGDFLSLADIEMSFQIGDLPSARIISVTQRSGS